jgi:quercetin dioxygenase-like cupin family protein
MIPSLTEYPLEDLVALYAAGALTAEEQVAFEHRRANGWPEAEKLLVAYTPVLDLLAEAPAVVPPSQIKEGILAALDPPPGYTIRTKNDAEFQPTSSPGVSIRLLSVDRTRKQFSCLLRFAPGARLAGHPHSVAEECIVLEGALYVGGVRMEAGDYQRVEAGVNHVVQWSDTGATAFITAPLDLIEHD